MRDLYMAERHRLFGIPVKEVAGWQGRGAELGTIHGSGNHHTACGFGTAPTPSLQVVIHGRPDVPGPLCNGLQGRDNFIYVVAAGRANHGGKGAWKGQSGNSHFFGLEIEYCGLMQGGQPLEPFTATQFDLAARWHASLAYYHGYSAQEVWQHFQYALPKGRKIDLLIAALNLHGGVDAFCQRIQWYIDHPPFKNVPKPPTPQEVPYKLDRVIGPGDRDTSSNAIVTRIENLLLLNAELSGRTGSRPGRIDKPGKGVYTDTSGRATDRFRHYWWDKYEADRPAAERHLANPKGIYVGRKVYDALVFDTLALAA